MAWPQVLYNANVVVNGVDLSNRCKKLKISFATEKKEVTAFGNSSRAYIVGLGVQSAEAEFFLDRGTGSVVQTLQALNNALTTGFTFSARGFNSAATTSNAIYSANVIIDGGFSAIEGTVGDVETFNVKFAMYAGSSWTIATTS